MTRLFVVLSLSSLLLLSETEGFPKNVQVCLTDFDCNLEFFCFSSEVGRRFCTPCNSCLENFMRSDGDVKCPRNGYECGECLSGFAAEELSSGDMSETCRPIRQEKLAKVDSNPEESIPETTNPLVSGFLIAIALVLIAVAIFCLASYTGTFNTINDNINQVIPSAPSFQTTYEDQPANNPILGLSNPETGFNLDSIHPKFEKHQRAEPFYSDSIEIDRIQPSTPSMPLSPAESNTTEPSTWTPFNDESFLNDDLSNNLNMFNQESGGCPSGSNIQEPSEANYGCSNYEDDYKPSCQPQVMGRDGQDDQINRNGHSPNNSNKRRRLD